MIFTYKSIEDLKCDSEKIIKHVEEKGYYAIRGLCDRDALRKKMKMVYKYANESFKLSSSGVDAEEIKTNLVKWSIGGQSKVQSNLARCMVTVYNTFFSNDIFGMHADFNTLMRVRDAIARRDLLTDNLLLPDRYNGCRIQIYPAGGGFMSMHRDTTAVESLRNKNDSYVQLVLLLTEKGLDYKEGGAFVFCDNNYIDSEIGTQTGDILVYDGSTLHGVSDIDTKESFDSENLRGRAVALVTIYKNIL